MNRFFKIFSTVFVIAILSSSQINVASAQAKSNSAKKSNQTKYITYQKSSSLKSSANGVDFSNQNYKYNSGNDEKNIKKDFNGYTRREKTTRVNENNFSENYFRIEKSKNSLWDGKHWDESSFPLKIFVKESSSLYYKSDYKDYVKYAMDVWRKADDRIQYKFVKSIDDADIAVIFVENLGDKYEENYLGLTDYDSNKNKQIEFSKIQISLIKNGNEKISAGEIKATIVHEFGHALGLGHSDREKDLMYPYISPNHIPELTYDELSVGDKLAIKDVINLSFDNKYVWK
ncbi:MAG: matrixin family metalloprotease [Ignavibacteriales bacterium]|nr:matrixin family metalloprotease [Ignavibacteriales bacterium]